MIYHNKEHEKEINKKKILQEIVAHQDYKNISKQLTKYINAYIRHLNERKR